MLLIIAIIFCFSKIPEDNYPTVYLNYSADGDTTKRNKSDAKGKKKKTNAKKKSHQKPVAPIY